MKLHFLATAFATLFVLSGATLWAQSSSHSRSKCTDCWKPAAYTMAEGEEMPAAGCDCGSTHWSPFSRCGRGHGCDSRIITLRIPCVLPRVVHGVQDGLCLVKEGLCTVRRGVQEGLCRTKQKLDCFFNCNNCGTPCGGSCGPKPCGAPKGGCSSSSHCGCGCHISPLFSRSCFRCAGGRRCGSGYGGEVISEEWTEPVPVPEEVAPPKEDDPFKDEAQETQATRRYLRATPAKTLLPVPVSNPTAKVRLPQMRSAVVRTSHYEAAAPIPSQWSDPPRPVHLRPVPTAGPNAAARQPGAQPIRLRIVASQASSEDNVVSFSGKATTTLRFVERNEK